MNSRLLVALCALVALPIVAEAQKQCVKGKPCGNSCIAANKTCHVGAPAATPAAQSASSAAEPSVSTYPWVASSRGQIYYRRGCSNASNLARENRRYFRTEEAARDAGYTRSKSKGC